MPLRTLVWNADERRPRAPVRLALAAVVIVLGILVANVALALALGPSGNLPGPVLASLYSTALLGVLTLVVAVAIDRRTVSDLGLSIDRDWWLDLGFGLLLGAALMTGIFAVALLAGWLRVEGTFAAGPGGFLAGFARLVGLFLVVGVAEELLARGYLLTNVAEGAAGYVSRPVAAGAAVLVSSLAFGAAHLQNPNATLVSAAGISLAGVFLASGYVLTGDLAIPVGLHVTWNLFQGGVYGLPVSGLALDATVVETTETGPDLFTGGAFGPEAGLLGVAALLVGTALVVAYVGWRYGEARLAPSLFVPELRWRDAEA